MIIEVILVLVVITALYRLYEWRVDRASNIPGNTSLPLIGTMMLMMKCNSFEDFWLQVVYPIFKKYEDYGIVRVWLGPMYCVNVMDPNFVQIIAESQFARDKSPLYALIFSEMTEGLFIQSGGPIVKELRRPILKSMTITIVNTEHLKVFIDKSNVFVEYIKNNVGSEEINIVHPLGNFLVDIMSATLFGVTTNEGYEKKFNFLYNLEKIMPSIYYQLATYGPFWKVIAKYTGSLAEILKHVDPLMELTDLIIDERKLKKSIKSEDQNEENYLDFLLRRAEEKNLSREQIKKELSDVLVGGVDTSAITTATALLFMAMFPEIQEKAYQEQLSVFGNSRRNPTYEDLKSMEYLSMIIKEVIRKTTPLGLIKNPSKDIKLGKYVVPKGSFMAVGSQMIHNSTKHWQRPESFYPEHFLPEHESARHKYAYLPFGISPRTCPGFRYGLLSVKVMLSTILRTFKLSTSKKYENIQYELHLLLQVKGGYPVNFEERIQNN